MRLWKVYRDTGSKDLFTVVAANDEAEAVRSAASLHDQFSHQVRSMWAEHAPLVGAPSVVEVPVLDGLVLDAGTLMRAEHGDALLRVILAPEHTLFDQVLAWARRQPAPKPGWEPSVEEEGNAVAKLVFRWGSYFTVIADETKPTWEHADRCPVGYFSDQEQARMNIEMSANVEALYALLHDEAAWRHAVWAVRRLPGPAPTDDMLVASTLAAFLEGGVEGGMLAAHETMSRVLAEAGRPVPPLPPEALEQARRAYETPEAFASYDLNPVRRVANALVLAVWRNPMEEYHGVTSDDEPPEDATPLGVNRFSPQDHAAITTRQAAAGNGILDILQKLAWLDAAEARRRLAGVLSQAESAYKWSLTESTRNVVLE